MVQESRAQVNAAGGAGADRPAARRKKKAAMREGPHAAVRHHRAERHPLRPGGMKKALLPLDAVHRGRTVFHRTRIADGRLAQQHGVLEAVGLGQAQFGQEFGQHELQTPVEQAAPGGAQPQALGVELMYER